MTTYEATVFTTPKAEVTGVVPFYGNPVLPALAGERCFYAGQEVAVAVGSCNYTLTGTTDGAGDAQVKSQAAALLP